MLFSVSRGSFMPAPNVDSAVIRLNIRSAPPCEVKNEQTMFRIIKAAFGQRRKTLHNALTGVGISKEEAALLLDAAGIPRQARAEELSLEQFAMLANTMK
jgi:16S rRNA (adenine1518-N6/adenine1519-N6)-dimethyltransferase